MRVWGKFGGEARAGEATIQRNALFLARKFPIQVSRDKSACTAPNTPIKVPKKYPINQGNFFSFFFASFSCLIPYKA